MLFLCFWLVARALRIFEIRFYSRIPEIQGPDLQNIIQQSYDKVMTMTEVMTNHTTDAIYKKSYDKVMINL